MTASNPLAAVSFKTVALSLISLALFVSCFFAAAPQVHAANGLTDSQISSVLGLLSAFDVPQATINNVNTILRGGSTGTPSAATNAAPTATLFQSVSTTTSDGKTGQSFFVSWNSTNATTCVVQKTTPDGVLQNPRSSGIFGTVSASPYMLGMHHWWIDCSGPGGTVHKDMYHIVGSNLTVAPTATLTQSVSTTTSDGTTGQTFTVSWSSTNATACVVQKTTPDGVLQNPRSSGIFGTVSASPYMLGMHHWWIDCSGPGGTVHKDMYHIVGSNLTVAPTATLFQSVSTTTSDGKTGQSFLVSWNSTNATTCIVQKTTPDGVLQNPRSSGTSGAVAASPYKLGTHHWWIDCSGPGGTVHKDMYHGVISASATVSSAVDPRSGGSLMAAAAMVPLSATTDSLNIIADQINQVNYALAYVLSAYVGLFTPDIPQAAAAVTAPAAPMPEAGDSFTTTLSYLPQSLYETAGKTTDFLAAVEMAPVYVITDALSDALFKAGLY